MDVPGTNCSQNILENYFGPKKGVLVPGLIAKKILFWIFRGFCTMVQNAI